MSADSALLVNLHPPGEDERRSRLAEEEIRSLIGTLGITVCASLELTVKKPNSTTYVGKGQAELMREAVLAYEAEEIVVNTHLSPRQEGNLERITGVPVSDREAVIISIFFQNARSREARLQIEKAQAEYLKPRLADREAAFSQQRGGVRGAKGEGERQIELERRRINDRIKALDEEIRKVADYRATQRKSRERNGIFSFALVGYTNAGKSTILNALTGSDILAEDKLFATLDTTTRSMELPNRQKVLVSDTVGFISDLPASLVKAFSSTLEEALSANALILVADASHPDALGCLRETERTLDSLGALDKARILVINKTDDIADSFSYQALKYEGRYIIVETSMKEGKGQEDLLEAMEKVTDEEYATVTRVMSFGNLQRIRKSAFIISENYLEDGVEVTFRIHKSFLGSK